MDKSTQDASAIMKTGAKPAGCQPGLPLAPAWLAYGALEPVNSSHLQASIALPDVHSGYGFAIGNVAASDMNNPEAVVSPGGVGFDINCGVRLIRTNLVRFRGW